MNSSLYIGATGLKTHSAGLQTLSTNLANVSTVGYKQQSMLFDDLMYEDRPPLGSAWPQAFNQTGMGVQVGAVRTLFTEGPLEPSKTLTDMAIEGKGFFEVARDGVQHYTRAGNFRFNKDGYLNDPNGYTLTGVKVVDGVPTGVREPIKLDMNAQGLLESPPKVTTEVTSIVNLGFKSNGIENTGNPGFSLLGEWNAKLDPPLAQGTYGYAQPMRIYDQNGNAVTATMYFDATSLGTGGQSVYEYVLALPPELDGGPAKGTAGAGLLMSGTLTFSSTGNLVDMSAFSPGGGDYKDLNNWTPSPLANGLPQVSMTTADGTAINFSLNLGIQGTGGWSHAPASAAAVGTDAANLPSLGASPTRSPLSSTALGTSSNAMKYVQNGYGIGSLSGLEVQGDGKVVASYTNGQSQVLYEIPVVRFTSEDGLRHEGMNHYSYTEDAGKREYGTAGTENYGKIRSNTIEMSNVDMSREMVNMIIMQRGFQMNSKSITTTDTMLQRALELKR